MPDDSAHHRIDAIGKQLRPPHPSLPPIAKVAPGSSLPRVNGKVVIITGKQPSYHPLPSNPRVPS